MPPEVQLEILGKKNALNAGATQLLATIPPNLLNAAIAVQCGIPGWFWDIAHSSGVFEAVVRIVETDSSHGMFETTFWEVAFHDDDTRMTKLVESASDEDLSRIFHLLLTHRVGCVGMFFPNAWATLLTRAESAQRRAWFSEIGSAVPACIEDLSELGDWLIREEDQEALLKLLDEDYKAEVLSIRLERGDIPTQVGLELLRGAIELRPPRLFGTYDHIKERLRRAGIQTADISKSIELARKNSFEQRERIERRFRRRDRQPTNWIEN